MSLRLIGARTYARNLTHVGLSQRSLSPGRVVTSSERDVDLITAVAIRVNAQREWYDGRGTGHKPLQCLYLRRPGMHCVSLLNALLTLTKYAPSRLFSCRARSAACGCESLNVSISVSYPVLSSATACSCADVFVARCSSTDPSTCTSGASKRTQKAREKGRLDM